MNSKNLSWIGLYSFVVLLTACGSGNGDNNASIYKIIADAGRNDYISRERRVELDGSDSEIKETNNKLSSATINYFWTFIGTLPQNITLKNNKFHSRCIPLSVVDRQGGAISTLTEIVVNQVIESPFSPSQLAIRAITL